MKKKIFIPIIAVSALLLTIFTILTILSSRDISFSKGIYYKTDTSHFIIRGSTPIVLSNKTNNEKIFEKLSDGDEILILHDGIRESYPCATSAYLCIKTADGKPEDVPRDIIEALDSINNTFIDTNEDLTQVSYSVGDGRYGICPIDPPPEEKIKLIDSTNEMQTHWESVCDKDGTVVIDPTDKYNEDFFKDKYLLLVYVFGPSGMTEYTVKGVEKSGDFLTVQLSSYTPEIHTDDCYASYIFIELSRDVELQNESFVNIEINGIRSFSYSDTIKGLSPDEPGLRFSDFKNTAYTEATSEEQALKLAKNELYENFSYDTVGIAFDRSEYMWAISFGTEGTCGGCITVFLSCDGITKAILAGE